ncbi:MULTISPECIES: 23S rRNA (pseudouridine(1915)-N(3))-methyltransferase RlmH [Ruminococcus]|jgi:23S rRNA (pseudouridine1915-N3)-methyltransferase|uniref:23S rRNA (pseudouridine(1915)-N(3))-methyltransferase RlmH n=1 Tax=Ruminococcus sp. TaxID=41978 RepID=UPI0025CEBDEA|nr:MULTISPECIES: 23S rRNA (pseudouridine(1915)-N(3))-methyltransferase RlmH [Ruminococcus]
MIKINIICIGKIKEKYFTDAIAEYAKRLTAFCKFNIVELSEERIKSNTPNQSQIDEVISSEGKRIMQKISPSDYVVAMCIEGKLMSSEELSKLIDNASVSGKSTVDFIIGGSYGLDESVKKRSDVRLSMSKMTFPHQMARMILSEQIYRAFEISSNGKYHK